MAEEIQIRINTILQNTEASRTIGELKDNLKELKNVSENLDLNSPEFQKVSEAINQANTKVRDFDNGLKNVNNSQKSAQQNFKSTSDSIKNLGVESASRGIEKMGAGFNNLKLSSVASGFRMVNAAMAANPVGAIATAVLALLSAFGGLEVIMKAVGDVAGMLFAPFTALFGAFAKGGEDIDYATQKMDEFNASLTGSQFAYDLEVTNLQNALDLMREKGATAFEIAEQERKIAVAKSNFLWDLEKKTAKQIEGIKVILEAGAIDGRKLTLKQIEDFNKNKVKLETDLQKIELELQRNYGAIDVLELKKRNAQKTQSNNNVVKALKADDNEALKSLQDRYSKEIKLIKDTEQIKINELKKQLAEGLIKQDEFEQKKLELNVETNNKLVEQNKNFKITDDEIKKVGAKDILVFEQTLADDKIKVNASYYDALIALAKNNEEKRKLQLEKEAEEARIRAEYLLSEEKRIYEQSLNAFENEFLLKKRQLQQNDDLTEEERKIKLEEAELEFLRNKLSITTLGNDEYFKLIQEIAEKEIDLNAAKNKKIQDDEKKNFEFIKKLNEEGFSAITSLSDSLFQIKRNNLKKGSEEEEKVAKRQFEVNKALSLSSAIVTGILTTMEAYKNGMKNPVPLLGPATAIVYATLAGLTSLANIAKIAATKFETKSISTTSGGGGGGGGGGGAAPEAPTFTPTSFFGLGQTTQFNPQEQGPTRVYVTEGDISNTQNRVRVVENRARFG